MTMRSFLKANSHCIDRHDNQTRSSGFVRSLLPLSVFVGIGQCLFSPTEHIKSAFVGGWNV